MSARERTRPEASSSNHARERATALSKAGSTFRGGSSPAPMMMRVSTPRRFIFSGTKRDRFTMLLVRTLAREQGISISRVTDIPSPRSSTLPRSPTSQAAASVSCCSRWWRRDADSRAALTSGESMSDSSSACNRPARSLRMCRATIATVRSSSGAERRQPFPVSRAEPGQAVDLIDHHDVNMAFANIGE